MNDLDIRDVAILDAFPHYLKEDNKTVLDVGCGKGRVVKFFASSNPDFIVHATDYERHKLLLDMDMPINLTFKTANIFNKESYKFKRYGVVICCEVLEHLVEYKHALKNLLSLTETRLIITVPWKHSFDNPEPAPTGHCNHWNDNDCNRYKTIEEFHKLCSPYSVSISKIRTKPKDVEMGQYGYLIIIDKRQHFNR